MFTEIKRNVVQKLKWTWFIQMKQIFLRILHIESRFFFHFVLAIKLLSSDRSLILRDASNELLNTHKILIDSQCDRKWQDYVYIQCEYKSTKQKIKHLLREENKLKKTKYHNVRRWDM